MNSLETSVATHDPSSVPPLGSGHTGTKSHIISIAGTDLTFECAEDDVLGRAALRAGIDLPYECNMGGCGACKLHVVSGQVQTVWPDAAGLTDRDRRKGQMLACQSRPLTDCTVALRAVSPTPVAPDLRPRQRVARFQQRRRLSASLSAFDFATDEDAQFLPGQYALLTLPGIEGQRAYSMANASNGQGLWSFIIRRVPNGSGTALLFETLNEGDPVTLDAPYGRGYWRPTERPVICMAGGSGLAPMLSVATAALAHGSPTEFFFGVGEAVDAQAASVLDPLANSASVSVVVSNPDQNWTGQTGLVHDAVAQKIPEGDAARYEYYMAGPPQMITAALELLILKRKVPFDQIHYDRFV